MYRLIILLSILEFTCIRGYQYEVRYLDVKLDQFTYTNNHTFKLKYLYNDTYWDKKEGPIFFYCGNEGAIEVFAENTGFQWESAERFKALIVFAEHRYYGDSLPFGNKTMDNVENRGYLSSLQALEDFVDVIDHIHFDVNRQRAGDPIKYPVIAFGGSYGGMLASWFRMKYPHIVQGALAASAPIWAFPNMAPCNYYMRTVTQVFNKSSPTCQDGIRASWKFIEDQTANDEGKQWLTDNWKLCTPIKTNDDVAEFSNWLSDMYSTLAMINYPYPNDFLKPVPANPIKRFCEIFDASKQSNLLLKFYEASQVYLNYTKTETCFKWSDGSSVDDLGLEGWSLQTCTEMVMPFCSTNEEMFQPFPWNFDYFSNNCQRNFKVSPSASIAEKLYGGFKIEAASNIIFSNGLLDPWSGAGVLTNISSTVIAVVIPEGAHHLDLRAANKDDPQSVIDARKFYELTFSKWIFEFQAEELKRQETHRKLKSFQQKQQSNKVDNEISRFLQEERKLTKSVKKTATVQRKYAKDVRKHSNLGMFHPRSVMLAMNSRRVRPKSPKAIENDYYVYKYGLRSLS